MFGLFWILDEHNATCLFDGTHSNRSVRSGTRENDSESIANSFSQGAKEQIDGRPLAARLVEFRG